MKQIQVIVIAFLHLEYKQIPSINRAGNTLFYNLETLARKYLPCLGQGGQKTYAVQRQAPAHIYTPEHPPPDHAFTNSLRDEKFKWRLAKIK